MFDHRRLAQLSDMKLFLAVLALVTAASAQTTVAPRFPDIIAGLTANGHFTVFTDLLTKSGLLPTINATAHFTVFAPTDSAFAKLSPDVFEAIKNDPARLTDLVKTHLVLTTNYRLHGVQQDDVLKSANNHQIRINTYPIVHTQTADGVNITIKNIPIVHGLAHGLDGVLTPPSFSSIQISLNRTDFSTFTSLLVSANLLNFFTADKDVTIFVPNNAAFAKLPTAATAYLNSHHADLADTLKYHVVRAETLFSIGMQHTQSLNSADSHQDPLMIFQDGAGGLTVNKANIIQRDIIATDGVIHVIDGVLIPPRVLTHIADNGIIFG
ncbi:unnamed protein product [Lymnaea stagnalis]|uniref:FAS1 domain-containing protein n=1 Tax=Lymnaea stagnalis TaxID=6523 RepID=A0AAV2H195_LYMST